MTNYYKDNRTYTLLPQQDVCGNQSAANSIDDEQFTDALQRCFRKSVYDEYHDLPRWALWS